MFVIFLQPRKATFRSLSWYKCCLKDVFFYLFSAKATFTFATCPRSRVELKSSTLTC